MVQRVRDEFLEFQSHYQARINPGQILIGLLCTGYPLFGNDLFNRKCFAVCIDAGITDATHLDMFSVEQSRINLFFEESACEEGQLPGGGFKESSDHPVRVGRFTPQTFKGLDGWEGGTDNVDQW